MILALVLAASFSDSAMMTDSVLVSASADSLAAVPADSTRTYSLGTTVVKGARRFRSDSALAREAWTTPSAMGLAGPLETLRSTPGVGFSGDLSGHFSTTGMPVEGSRVTWDGMPLLWPWHFGGLFGALDDWAVGSVRWNEGTSGRSPAGGGGWLETRSRIWTDSDQVHAGAKLGFVAGGAATWGKKGDWSWQAGARRTWLGAALELAKERGWTDQDMQVEFLDADIALGWKRGPWRASVGALATEDTVGISSAEGSDEVGISWRNLSIPVQIGWHDGNWRFDLDGGWSMHSRRDGELASTDTLSLARAGLVAEQRLGDGWTLQFGADVERYRSVHHLDEPWDDRGWFGDEEAIAVRSFAGVGRSGNASEWRIWGGNSRTTRETFVPQGGGAMSVRIGEWRLDASVEHRATPVCILDQSQRQVDAASPAWVLPPGESPRTTAIRFGSVRSESHPSVPLSTVFRILGWYRIHDGLWNWTLEENRMAPYSGQEDRWVASRSDGWSAGLEAGGALSLRRLELSGRQILSMDVLRRRSDEDGRFPSRWAPWDQRWRTELQAEWRWKGGGALPGTFGISSSAICRFSSGLPRSRVLAPDIYDARKDIDTTFVRSGSGTTFERVRTPYFRIDLTPIRFGREGRWSFWWSIVNLTNESNLMGWAFDGWEEPIKPVSQIPFLPVVFGAQIEI